MSSECNPWCCPDCGGMSFARTYPARGKWIEWVQFREDGTIKETGGTTDSIVMVINPKRMKCEGCGKTVENYEAPEDP